MESKSDDWYIHDPEKQAIIFTPEDEAELADPQKEVNYHSDIFEVIRTIDEPEKRQIGHAAYHSSFSISSQEPGYLKNWTLIQLDADKYAKGPENKVFIGNRFHDEDTEDIFSGHSLGILQNGFLKLNLENAIEAVARKPTDAGPVSICWEISIIPSPRPGNATGSTTGFTDPGDSGSCVFDLEGRVVGLVTGRSIVEELENKLKTRPNQSVSPDQGAETEVDLLPEWPSRTDVVFATPIEWVLADTQRLTGQQPELA